MKYRVAAWAGAGFMIAGFWTLYLFPNAAAVNPMAITLARLTCPIAFLHYSVHFYWVLLANAATYSLVGFVVARLRFARGWIQLSILLPRLSL